MNVSSNFSRQSRQGAVLTVAALFLFLANAPAVAAGLILWDSFNDETAFSRADGYHFFTVTPDVGTEGILRYWEPGYWGSGATTASYINFSPAGRFGSGVTFNYSGNSNGWCSQDAINYPVGDQMSPAEGTIEFWYKPHFDHTDTSAVIQVLSGFKSNLDYPLQTYYERERDSQSYLYFSYHGWGGRHYWTFAIYELNASGNVTHDTFARTPPEFDPNRFTFSAEQWMHVGLVWKSTGADDYGNKTVMMFIDGVEVASTTQTYSTTYPFGEFLVLGSSTGQSFDPSLPGNNYSGASGDIDNLKIWDYAKTDFSDRFVEGVDAQSAYVGIASVPDINGNLSPEIAALLTLPDGQPQVIIKDSDTKELIAKMDFGNPNQTAKGVTGLLDITGNGAPEVAVLLTRRDGVSVVQMRDGRTGQWIDKIYFFCPPWETKAVASQDLNLDGVSEVSVLATRPDGKVATKIKDSISKELMNWIGFPGTTD